MMKLSEVVIIRILMGSCISVGLILFIIGCVSAITSDKFVVPSILMTAGLIDIACTLMYGCTRLCEGSNPDEDDEYIYGNINPHPQGKAIYMDL